MELDRVRVNFASIFFGFFLNSSMDLECRAICRRGWLVLATNRSIIRSRGLTPLVLRPTRGHFLGRFVSRMWYRCDLSSSR